MNKLLFTVMERFFVNNPLKSIFFFVFFGGGGGGGGGGFDYELKFYVNSIIICYNVNITCYYVISL